MSRCMLWYAQAHITMEKINLSFSFVNIHVEVRNSSLWCCEIIYHFSSSTLVFVYVYVMAWQRKLSNTFFYFILFSILLLTLLLLSFLLISFFLPLISFSFLRQYTRNNISLLTQSNNVRQESKWKRLKTFQNNNWLFRKYILSVSQGNRTIQRNMKIRKKIEELKHQTKMINVLGTDWNYVCAFNDCRFCIRLFCFVFFSIFFSGETKYMHIADTNTISALELSESEGEI